MLELTGSLESVDFPKLLSLLTGLQQSGYLRMSSSASVGEVFLEPGRAVAAFFGTAREPELLRGISALEAVVLLLPRARFVYTGAPAPSERNIELASDELSKHLSSLLEPSEALKRVDFPLTAIPSIVSTTGHESEEVVLLTRTSLYLLTRIDGRRRVHELIQGQPLLPAIQHLLELKRQRVICFDTAASYPPKKSTSDADASIARTATITAPAENASPSRLRLLLERAIPGGAAQ